MAPCRPASSWDDFCARHGPVLINLPYQYLETCHCFLLFFFVFAVMLWRCFLGPCSWFQFPVQETEHVPDHLVLVIFQFCQTNSKYCKYKVGIHFLNTWNILYSIFTVLQNSPQAILILLYSLSTVLICSTCQFLVRVDFLPILKSGWWMLQCTCSNVAVLFAQPHLIVRPWLTHMINQSGSDLMRDHGPWPSSPSSSPSSSSYSHSSGSASVSNVGIHCSKTEELTCCPFMLSSDC